MSLFYGYKYKKIKVCITLSLEVYGDLKPFQDRLYAILPRIVGGFVLRVSIETYQDDNKKNKKHLNAYKKINKILDSRRYHNIMDMNARLGSFATTIQSSKLCAMNLCLL
ncbi:methyltransferase PMT2 [Spatholobus suberectus]|nr:methyltransferase PMT2 [Spatholobus suberectus]